MKKCFLLILGVHLHPVHPPAYATAGTVWYSVLVFWRLHALPSVLVVTMAASCAFVRSKMSQKYQIATHQIRISSSKCTKLVSCWDFALKSARGAYGAPQTLPHSPPPSTTDSTTTCHKISTSSTPRRVRWTPETWAQLYQLELEWTEWTKKTLTIFTCQTLCIFVKPQTHHQQSCWSWTVTPTIRISYTTQYTCSLWRIYVVYFGT